MQTILDNLTQCRWLEGECFGYLNGGGKVTKDIGVFKKKTIGWEFTKEFKNTTGERGKWEESDKSFDKRILSVDIATIDESLSGLKIEMNFYSK